VRRARLELEEGLTGTWDGCWIVVWEEDEVSLSPPFGVGRVLVRLLPGPELSLLFLGEAVEGRVVHALLTRRLLLEVKVARGLASEKLPASGALWR